jgi:hypothetical protein
MLIRTALIGMRGRWFSGGPWGDALRYFSLRRAKLRGQERYDFRALLPVAVMAVTISCEISIPILGPLCATIIFEWMLAAKRLLK